MDELPAALLPAEDLLGHAQAALDGEQPLEACVVRTPLDDDLQSV